ncbi:hypothetical protein QCA50_008557 [Cerrena zonata]|uniref:Uncharacterized protein n=1 Tax=Cerrena zonata TaxID=2478898 RepID=A0AAW0G9H8_9APHY
MPSPYATQEPAVSLWFEQTIHAGIHLGSIAYGMHILIYSTCAYYLIHEGRKGNWKWLTYITLLLALGTLNIAINMHLEEVDWINERNFPGGPLAHLISSQSSALNVAGDVASDLVPFFADGLLIYRVYIVWGKWYMAVIPGIALLATLALGILSAVQTAQPNASLWSNGVLNFTVPFFSLTMALNIFLTLLLIFRLLYMRHQLRSTIGPQYGRTYTSIATMILESALPNALISFIFVVLYAIHNPAANLLLPLQVQLNCFSPVLIILRVTRGRAWTANTVSELQNGSKSLRFDTSAYSSTAVGANSGNGGADMSMTNLKRSHDSDSNLASKSDYVV